MCVQHKHIVFARLQDAINKNQLLLDTSCCLSLLTLSDDASVLASLVIVVLAWLDVLASSVASQQHARRALTNITTQHTVFVIVCMHQFMVDQT
jgi:hypothetical protein